MDDHIFQLSVPDGNKRTSEHIWLWKCIVKFSTAYCPFLLFHIILGTGCCTGGNEAAGAGWRSKSCWFSMLQLSLHTYLGSCLCPCPELTSECMRERRGTMPPLRSELCRNTYHICFPFKTNFLGCPVPPALQTRKQMQRAGCAALTSEVLSQTVKGVLVGLKPTSL